MLFDVHTHVHFPIYDKDRSDVMKRAREAGVKMILVGTQASTSASAIALAEKNPKDAWATAGFHPNHLAEEWYHDKKEQSAGEPEQFDIDRLRELAEHPKVVAIGECGLDYYRLENNREAQIKKQKAALEAQIELAASLGKPLMMHNRPSKGNDDAYEDALAILKSSKTGVDKICHFYVGSLAITRQLAEAGFYFTFGGVITFSRDYDEVIKYIPLDRILLETDAPYVAPEPYRGRRNEPAYIIETAKVLAQIKETDFEKVSEQTTANVLKVFRIKV